MSQSLWDWLDSQPNKAHVLRQALENYRKLMVVIQITADRLTGDTTIFPALFGGWKIVEKRKIPLFYKINTEEYLQYTCSEGAEEDLNALLSKGYEARIIPIREQMSTIQGTIQELETLAIELRKQLSSIEKESISLKRDALIKNGYECRTGHKIGDSDDLEFIVVPRDFMSIKSMSMFEDTIDIVFIDGQRETYRETYDSEDFAFGECEEDAWLDAWEKRERLG